MLNKMMVDVPRLSGALRVERDSNRPDLLLTHSDSYKLLASKKRKTSCTAPDWSELCEGIVKSCSKNLGPKVVECLRL